MTVFEKEPYYGNNGVMKLENHGFNTSYWHQLSKMDEINELQTVKTFTWKQYDEENQIIFDFMV